MKVTRIVVPMFFAFAATALAQNADKPKHDPTQVSPKLRDALKTPESAGGRARAFMLPKITVKGMVQAAGKPAAAVIEVEGTGILLVRSGSEVRLSDAERTPGLLVVREVSKNGVRVEVAGLEGEVVVR